LVIIVTLTAGKDGYEDYKRHQSDRRVNSSTVRVLTGKKWVNPNMMEGKSRTFIRGLVSAVRKPQLISTLSKTRLTEKTSSSKVSLPASVVPDADYDYEDAKSGDPHWRKTLWEDVKVGDFVKLMENDSFPADILICATSDEDNLAYVETKNLDGETNLKSRNAVPALTHLRDAAACADGSNAFRINCDPPENNMYRLNAAVVDKDGTHAADLQTTLLRGTVLRNTSWVIGVVLYTGEDTKIVMNSGGTPSKRSKVERQMNPQVYVAYSGCCQRC
jgi:phospholipid-translocating ATPase